MTKDVFENLDSLRLTQEEMAGSVGAREVLKQVPLRKPNRSEFFRIHPDPAMSLVTTVYEDKEMRETFLVLPGMRPALLGEAKSVMIVTAITQRKVTLLWPLALPDETGRSNPWRETAWEAYELAKKNWIRIAADMQLSAYRIYQAEGELPEPTWPDKAFNELLEIAFRGRIIGDEQHPTVKRIRGRP